MPTFPILPGYDHSKNGCHSYRTMLLQEVPFGGILQNTVSCFFLAKSRSRKQFGTINKLYSRHFTSDNIREGNKKWRSCIQNKRSDFEKQKEEKNKPFRSLSNLTPLLVLLTLFSLICFESRPFIIKFTLTQRLLAGNLAFCD